MKQNRIDDLQKAIEDEEYRLALYAEFNPMGFANCKSHGIIVILEKRLLQMHSFLSWYICDILSIY